MVQSGPVPYFPDARHDNPALQEKLERIYTLRRGKTIDLSIRPEYFELLRRLGDPHRHLPPVIHVAGTNGKGSTIAFMKAILEAAGYSVHVYTSPHLLRFNERIVLNGKAIDDHGLESLLDEILLTNGDLPQTFFELTTAMALTAFARHPADIVLLETGLGGRLDSTNVISAPAMTVITLLSFDHCEFLGSTIDAIAFEKAGILKPGCPVVIAPQIHPAALPVLQKRAGEIHAPVIDWRKIVASESAHEPFGVQAGSKTLKGLPEPALHGAHQFDNAGTACAALLTLDGFQIPEIAYRKGLQSADWPARLQLIDPSHASRLTPQGWEVWLDGGHNDSAAQILANQARKWTQTDSKSLHIVTAMKKTKNADAFARPLAPLAASVTCIPFPGEDHIAGHDPAELADIWRQCGVKTTVAGKTLPLSQILKTISSEAKTGRILLTGSLHLASLNGLRIKD